MRPSLWPLILSLLLPAPALARPALVTSFDLGTDPVAVTATGNPFVATFRIGPHFWDAGEGLRPYIGVRFHYDWNQLDTGETNSSGGGATGAVVAVVGAEIFLIPVPDDIGFSLSMNPAGEVGTPIYVGVEAMTYENSTWAISGGGHFTVVPTFHTGKLFSIGAYGGI